MPRIVTVTLNPALDLTTSVARLEPGRKLRCASPAVDAGGGGVNVSRALAILGHQSLAFIAVGGAVGEELKTLVTDAGIETVWFEIDGTTRQSFSVHDLNGGGQYRFVLPGPEWTSAQFDSCLNALKTLIAADDVVVVSGSMPPGAPEDAVLRISRTVSASGARVIADTSGRTLAALTSASTTPLAALVMDENEAGQLHGSADLDIRSARQLAEKLITVGAASTVVITLGHHGAVACTRAAGAWKVTPPHVQVLSTVGAGDSFVAGFVLGLSEGWALPDALSYAMGAATSAVTTPATDLCTREGTDRFARDVQAEILPARSP